MAGDWIKMRTNLWNHPKVIRLAASLNVSKAAVIGAFHGMWSMADQHSEDGNLEGIDPDALDAMVELPGFAAAVQLIGWLEVTDSGVSLPRFSEHNGRTAKKRASDAKRQAASRTRHAPVTQGRDESVTGALPSRDKRREEERRGNHKEARAKPKHRQSSRLTDLRDSNHPAVESLVSDYPGPTGSPLDARRECQAALEREAAANGDDFEKAAQMLSKALEAFKVSKFIRTHPNARAGPYVPSATTWYRDEHYKRPPAEWDRHYDADRERKRGRRDAEGESDGTIEIPKLG